MRLYLKAPTEGFSGASLTESPATPPASTGNMLAGEEIEYPLSGLVASGRVLRAGEASLTLTANRSSDAEASGLFLYAALVIRKLVTVGGDSDVTPGDPGTQVQEDEEILTFTPREVGQGTTLVFTGDVAESIALAGADDDATLVLRVSVTGPAGYPVTLGVQKDNYLDVSLPEGARVDQEFFLTGRFRFFRKRVRNFFFTESTLRRRVVERLALTGVFSGEESKGIYLTGQVVRQVNQSIHLTGNLVEAPAAEDFAPEDNRLHAFGLTLYSEGKDLKPRITDTGGVSFREMMPVGDVIASITTPPLVRPPNLGESGALLSQKQYALNYGYMEKAALDALAVMEGADTSETDAESPLRVLAPQELHPDDAFELRGTPPSYVLSGYDPSLTHTLVIGGDAVSDTVHNGAGVPNNPKGCVFALRMDDRGSAAAFVNVSMGSSAERVPGARVAEKAHPGGGTTALYYFTRPPLGVNPFGGVGRDTPVFYVSVANPTGEPFVSSMQGYLLVL